MSETERTDIARREESGPPVIAEGPGALLAAFVDLARRPDVNPETVAAWAAIQERMEEKQAKREFDEAYDRLAEKLPRVKKNGTVEYKNKQTGALEKSFNFGRWEDIDTIIRPLLHAEHFNLSFDTAPRQGDGGGIIVTGTLSHVAGHQRKASIPVPLDTSGGKNNIQGYGSALSYGKRYTTTALLNLVFEGEDDDGQRGGMKFITEQQAEILRTLLRETKYQEGPFLDQLFAGAVRAVEKIEAGGGFIAARSTLEGIKRRQAKAKQETPA